MPNAFDGLGAEAPYVPDYLQDEIQFRIDNDLRTIAIPPEGVVLGVVGDKNVNHVNFQMPAWYNGFNMSLFQARINFIDAAGNANYYTVTDMTVLTPEGNEVVGVPSDDDIIYFTWLVDSYATGYVGQVKFNVRLTKFDTSTNPAVLSQAFNTQINSCQVLEGIQLADEITQEQAEDLLFHYSSELGDITEGYKHDIEEKAEATLVSIPDDYTTLGNDVTDLKNEISEFEDWKATPFDKGYRGERKSKFELGMISPSTGQKTEATDRAISSELIDIRNTTYNLIIKATSYSIYKIGVACYDSDKSHLGNVGYFTNDSKLDDLLDGTAYIRIICAKNVNANLNQSDLDWMKENIRVYFGSFLIDKSIKAHYSTKTAGGNSNEKYAYIGFLNNNKANPVLNPTNNISYVGIIFKDKRYSGNISTFSLDKTYCGSNENKLIYLNPETKTFYVIDGLDPTGYNNITDNCAFIGFVNLTVPEISKTSMQMSVDGNNINPYSGEYVSRIKNLEKRKNLFSTSHYSLDANGNNTLDRVPLLEFSSQNKASVQLTSVINRITIAVDNANVGMNISEITLNTSSIGTGDNKLVYLNPNTKTIYVFDGTNPASHPEMTDGNVFLGLVCVAFPEVSICKIQMSIDGKNLMMSRASEMELEKYAGKTFSVMGDSVSRFDERYGGRPSGTSGWGGNTYKSAGYNIDEMWWSQLAKMTGLKINTINANAGSTCSTANPDRIACSSDTRCSALDNGTDPDFIICEVGTNDFLYGASLGQYDGTSSLSTDTSTFKIAYANMLNKMHVNYPAAKIICCTVHQHIYSDYVTASQNLPTVVNKNGLSLREFNDCIREVARLYGAEIIDFETCGLNVRNVANLTFDTGTNYHLHPTNVGQFMLATAAAKIFK